jgi:hypothetical protein
MFDKKEYDRKWRLAHPERCKINAQKYNSVHPERDNGGKMSPAKKLFYYYAEKIPLAEFCEFCPEDDKQKAVERHHPDHDYPEIFVSVCKSCHMYIEPRRMKK